MAKQFKRDKIATFLAVLHLTEGSEPFMKMPGYTLGHLSADKNNECILVADINN
jgi:hypothetical protein